MNSISSKMLDKQPINKLYEKLFIISAILLFVVLVVGVYKLFIENKKNRLPFAVNYENFEDTITTTKAQQNIPFTFNDTVYEKAIKTVFGNNPRLVCNLIPSNSNVCTIKTIKLVKYKFPVNIIKLQNSSVLAVFNDGRLYQKEDMYSNLWKGPLDNSLPNNQIFLRMITLSTDLKTLLGVGYDNNLYSKIINVDGKIDLTGVWKKVPNNSDIIYVIFDKVTGLLISIDKNGKLLIKTSADITSKNKQLTIKLDRPLLKLMYDVNGYMLALDNKFNLYQFKELTWTQGGLNLERGANPSKLMDIIYDNDGKLFGLVLNEDMYKIDVMKQTEGYYLSRFYPIELETIDNSKKNFLMSDLDIIKLKNGNVTKYIYEQNTQDDLDEDVNMAYNKQILENKKKLREFCKARGSSLESTNYQNYDLISDVESNETRINDLRNIVTQLIQDEPNKQHLIEKYPVITLPN